MSAASQLAHSSTPFFGATLVARDWTRFRLWAPQTSRLTDPCQCDILHSVLAGGLPNAI